MPSRISANRRLLARRHYVRKATAANHWFDFTASRLEQYRRHYGDDFCLVINGSTDADDAYVIPFSQARRAFSADALDHRGRWVGTVRDEVLHLTPSGRSLNVRAFHNAFEFLNL